MDYRNICLTLLGKIYFSTPMIPLKSKATVFYFLIIAVFGFSNARAQIHMPVYRELIVELPNLNFHKSLNSTVFPVVSLGGIKYEGICIQMKCLLLRVDENIHADNSAIMNKLKDLNVAFVIKPTGKIWQVKEQCQDPVSNSQEPVDSYTD